MCIRAAPAGYYVDEENRSILECHESCSTCSGPNESDCTDCASGKIN